MVCWLIFSRLRDEDVSPHQYRAWAKEKVDQFQKKPLSTREEKEKIEIVYFFLLY